MPNPEVHSIPQVPQEVDPVRLGFRRWLIENSERHGIKMSGATADSILNDIVSPLTMVREQLEKDAAREAHKLGVDDLAPYFYDVRVSIFVREAAAQLSQENSILNKSKIYKIAP